MLKQLVLLCILSCVTMALPTDEINQREIPSATYLVCTIKRSKDLLVELPHCMTRLNTWSCRKKDDRSTFLLQEMSRSVQNLDLLTSRAVMLRVDKNATLCTCKSNTDKASFEQKTLPTMTVYTRRSRDIVDLSKVHSGHLKDFLNDIEKREQLEQLEQQRPKRVKVNFSFVEMTNYHPLVEVLVVKNFPEEQQNAVPSQYSSLSS